uniref:ADP-ribosylhydrolase ARH3 n=1 Tax=Arcella intermedia TaxID=1963864 RepID=A0A6B2LBX6_9EUKA
MTIACALSLIDNPNLNKLARKYISWLVSGPFDIGGTTFRALGCHNVCQWKPKIKEQGIGKTVIECAKSKNMKSISNGCLMRATSLAIWGHKLPIEQLKEISYLETSLTNPNPLALEAVFCYRLAIVHLLNNLGDYLGAFQKAFEWAKANASVEVVEWLQKAQNREHVPVYPDGGHLKIGLIEAFIGILNRTEYYEAVKEIISKGGDTDTNGMIVGALIGATHGTSAIPEHMKRMVLNCHTNQKGSQIPRPDWLLAHQVPSLVTQLLDSAPNTLDMQLFLSNLE